jgi:hypothetical protein
MPEAISSLELFLKGNNIIFRKLPVNRAFHSSFIDGMESGFKLSVAAMDAHPSQTPVIACAHNTFAPQVTAGYRWDVIRKRFTFGKPRKCRAVRMIFIISAWVPAAPWPPLSTTAFIPAPKRLPF